MKQTAMILLLTVSPFSFATSDAKNDLDAACKVFAQANQMTEANAEKHAFIVAELEKIGNQEILEGYQVSNFIALEERAEVLSESYSLLLEETWRCEELTTLFAE